MNPLLIVNDAKRYSRLPFGPLFNRLVFFFNSEIFPPFFGESPLLLLLYGVVTRKAGIKETLIRGSLDEQ